jgi:hypothetical protein
MTFQNPDTLGTVLAASGLTVCFVAVGFGAYFGFMFRECRTNEADLGTRMFVPWWPWLDGMLDEEGTQYRKPWVISHLVFLGGFALMGIAFWRAGGFT